MGDDTCSHPVCVFPALCCNCCQTHLSVLIVLLVVEISFEGEFGATDVTLEASPVEEGEVFEGTHFVHLIHSLSTAKAQVFVRCGSEPLADRDVLCRP